MSGYSLTPTPYAVNCLGAARCGLVFLTHTEYMRQMHNVNRRWQCPSCGEDASWDDENYETHMDARDAEREADDA